MKYCANCGTQMSDETQTCPQCQTSTNNQCSLNTNSIPKRNKLIKLYIVIPIVIVVTIITSITTCFVLQNFTDKGNFTLQSTNDTCPAAEYGHHDWASANCTEPAQCYNCGAYRDDRLGNHSWWENSDGFEECYYCDMLYDDYIDSKE